MTTQLLQGDCRDILKTLADQSVQTVVTSPPYFGLRNYGVAGQIGLEATPQMYVAALVAVFRDVRRVLRDDGTLWLNLGDSYAGSGRGGNPPASPHFAKMSNNVHSAGLGQKETYGLKQKDLIGVPWRVAFALQDDGWYLRSDIIWAKPNCMPESVTDRPTRSHEYLFLFAKSERYFYDAAAIAEPVKQSSLDRINQATFDSQTGGPKDYANGTNPNRSMRGTLENFAKRGKGGKNAFRGQGANRDGENGPSNREGRDMQDIGVGLTRNRRTVWTIATRPYSEAHFATFPEALVEPCILAGSSAQACETCGAAWGRVVEREAGMVNTDEGARQQTRSAGAQTGGTAKVTLGVTEHVIRHDRGIVPRCTCTVNTGSVASTVMDPFGGSGTVAKVANRLQRSAILIELNPTYIEMQEKRTDGVQVELFV